MGSSEDRSETLEARRWHKLVRELGLVGIAAAAAVSIVGIVVQARQPQVAVTDPAAPVATALPAPALASTPPALSSPATAPQPPTYIEPDTTGGVTIYNAGSSEAFSVTVGNAGGVSSITTHHLGGGYQYSVEFLRLLKQRDPKLYAWVQQERRAKADRFSPLQQPPGSVVVGETDYGQEIVAGQTLVVPLKPRSEEEIEKDYQNRYEWTRSAYVMDQARQQEHERVQQRLAAEAKAKGIPLDEYIGELSKKYKSRVKTTAK
jgi:hypothetical protein